MDIRKEIARIFNTNQSSDIYISFAEQHGIEKILLELEKMLKGDANDVKEALFFLRDMSLYRNKVRFNKLVKLFRAAILDSQIFSIMNTNLYSSDYAIRANTVDFMGKMFFPEKAYLLLDAIDVYVEKYPKDLKYLLFEYFWLIGKKDVNLLKRLMALENKEVKQAAREYLEMIHES